MKCIISLIILAEDKSVPFIDGNYTRILLNEDNSIPQYSFTSFKDKDHSFFLNKICEKFINYKYEFLLKRLCSIQMHDNVIEVIYVVNVPYVFSFNKCGTVYGIKELSDKKIELEDKYVRAITGNGTAFY